MKTIITKNISVLNWRQHIEDTFGKQNVLFEINNRTVVVAVLKGSKPTRKVGRYDSIQMVGELYERRINPRDENGNPTTLKGRIGKLTRLQGIQEEIELTNSAADWEIEEISYDDLLSIN